MPKFSMPDRIEYSSEPQIPMEIETLNEIRSRNLRKEFVLAQTGIS